MPEGGYGGSERKQHQNREEKAPRKKSGILTIPILFHSWEELPSGLATKFITFLDHDEGDDGLNHINYTQLDIMGR